jgi:hypothetical protein
MAKYGEIQGGTRRQFEHAPQTLLNHSCQPCVDKLGIKTQASADTHSHLSLDIIYYSSVMADADPFSDEYVAGLMAKDAEKSAIKYSALGMEAFLSSKYNFPSVN